MPVNQKGRCLLSLLLVFAPTVMAQSSGPRLTCNVEEKGVDGRWLATRYVSESTGAAVGMSESYTWTPAEKASFAPGATFSWSLSYEIRPGAGDAVKAVAERDVVVDMDFWFDAQQAGTPMRASKDAALHLYRSSDPQKEFRSSSTSLTTSLLWSEHNNGNVSARVSMPLDSVLAFGTGLDTLVWNMRTAPNSLGGTSAIVAGTMPVVALRNKVGAIPKLRRALDRKAANFRKECQMPITMVGG